MYFIRLTIAMPIEKNSILCQLNVVSFGDMKINTFIHQAANDH